MMSLSDHDVSTLKIAGWDKCRISYLQDHLALRQALPIYTIEVAQRFANGSLDVLACVAAMLQRLDPSNSDLPVLYAASHALRRKNAKPRQGPGKGRLPRWSVPLKDVSENEIVLFRNNKIPKNTLYSLRQIYGAARRAGLPEAFNRPALAAFRDELDVRDIAAVSIEMAMEDCLRIGKLFNVEESLLDLIRIEKKSAALVASGAPSKRKADFRANPITPLDYAMKAREVSIQAYASTAGRQTRHKLFMTAGFLATLSWFPNRISDILALVVGREIKRDKKGWQLDFHAGKTGYDMALPVLPDILTPYLDDLILLGADPGLGGEVLDQLYRQRVAMQSPIFATIGLKEAYSQGRAFELVKAETGHGPHAARKSMPDYCAEIGMPIEDAMALLGHANRATTEHHYEVFASKHRRSRSQDELTFVRRKLFDKEEVFRTPSGKLIDIVQINKTLRRKIG